MSQETKPYRTNVHLTFPPTISGAPLVCNLTRLFDWGSDQFGTCRQFGKWVDWPCVTGCYEKF